MTETLTKSPKGQDAEKAQEKKRRLEPAPLPAKVLADEAMPFTGLVGVSATNPSLESHAAFLGDPRFSHPANHAQKARIVTELQHNYGNRYVQRLAEGSKGVTLDEDIMRRIEAQRGLGKSLEPEVRSQMEGAFEHDFGAVKIHTGAEADMLSQQLEAKAFTTGKDIFFREGAYEPASETGTKLIGHELAHVVQQESMRGGEPQSPAGAIQRQQCMWQEPLEKQPEEEPEEEAGPQRRRVSARKTRPYPDMELDLKILEIISKICAWRHKYLNAYVGIGKGAIDMASWRLAISNSLYRQAYAEHAGILRVAEKEAQNQQRWTDVFTGLGAGLVVGTVALLLPETITAGVVAMVVGNVAAAEIGLLAQVTGILDIPGKEVRPTGVHPDLMNSRIWKNLAMMYRSLDDVRPLQSANTLLWVATRDVVAEMKLHLRGGKPTMSPDAVKSLASTAQLVDKTLGTVDDKVEAGFKKWGQLTAAAASPPDYPYKRMLQDIWIMWISKLSHSDSNILDLDTIEDHLHDIGVLGKGSRLGIDFGKYTEGWEEERAIDRAKNVAFMMERKYKALTGGSV